MAKEVKKAATKETAPAKKPAAKEAPAKAAPVKEEAPAKKTATVTGKYKIECVYGDLYLFYLYLLNDDSNVYTLNYIFLSVQIVM